MYVLLAPPLGSTWAENSSCSPLFPRAESKVWPGQALSKCSWKGLVGGFRSQCRSLPGVMDCRSVCLKLRAVPLSAAHRYCLPTRDLPPGSLPCLTLFPWSFGFPDFCFEALLCLFPDPCFAHAELPDLDQLHS